MITVITTEEIKTAGKASPMNFNKHKMMHCREKMQLLPGHWTPADNLLCELQSQGDRTSAPNSPGPLSWYFQSPVLSS